MNGPKFEILLRCARWTTRRQRELKDGWTRRTGAQSKLVPFLEMKALHPSCLQDHARAFHLSPPWTWLSSAVYRPQPHVPSITCLGWVPRPRSFFFFFFCWKGQRVGSTFLFFFLKKKWVWISYLMRYFGQCALLDVSWSCVWAGFQSLKQGISLCVQHTV